MELGAGGPPKCLAGEPDGTRVSVIEFVGCENGWLRESTSDVGLSIVTGLAEFSGLQPIRYAAFVLPCYALTARISLCSKAPTPERTARPIAA